MLGLRFSGKGFWFGGLGLRLQFRGLVCRALRSLSLGMNL